MSPAPSPPPSPPRADRPGAGAARLAQLLTAPQPDLQAADLPLVVGAGLAGELRRRLPAGHAQRAALERPALAMVARSLLIRRAMLTLLEALARSEVPSLLLKGFALSELVYPAPGTRFYGDVDLLLHEADLPRALEAARALGWRSDGLDARPEAWTHEMAHLLSPDGQVRLDVHRYAAEWQRGRRGQRRLAALTRAFWAHSREARLGDVPVRLPGAADLALHLALSRGWTGDAGLCKPADLPDLQAIVERFGLTPAAVERRARDLGLRRSWAAFRRVCDPWTGQFSLQDGPGARRLRAAALADGSPRSWGRLLNAPATLRRTLAALPDALAVRLALRVPGDPRQLPARWALAERRDAPPEYGFDDLIIGARRLTRLLYPRSPGDCVPRALTTYRGLVRRGFPAVFVSGVRRREDGQLEGHAWVEGPHGPLEAYGEGANRTLFQVLFEHRSGAAQGRT